MLHSQNRTIPTSLALTPSRLMLVALLACAALGWAAHPFGRVAVVLLALLCAPGYLIAALLPSLRQGWLVQVPIWIGLSLSSVALLYQWATLAGLALTTPILAVLLGLCVAATSVHWWQHAEAAATTTHHRGYWWSLALLAVVFGVTLWVRFVQIADLALPPWVDSVHHALMIRVTAERGLAPLNLEPYLPVTNLPYHWGYHVVMAAVLQLSGVPLTDMMIWTGQILNALHVPISAALALALWRKPAAAPITGLVVGLLSLLPAYYLAWGRYTQLTGLLMLPGLVIVWQQALNTSSRRWWAAAALVLAGLSLVHMRVLFFALSLVAVMSGVWALHQPWPAIRGRFMAAVLCAVAALALTLPWLALLAQRTLLPAVATPQNLVIPGNYNALRGTVLWIGNNRALIALALLAAGYGLWRRSATTVVLIGWVGLMFTLANPQLLTHLLPACGVVVLIWGIQHQRLVAILGSMPLLVVNPWLVTIPSIYVINNDAVLITIFLPIGLVIGGSGAALLERVQAPMANRGRRLTQAGAALVLVGLALWGAWDMRTVVNSTTVIATLADRNAISWIDANTAPDARFLINASRWIPGTDRGVDGGWWLLPLTGRWTSTPPALFIYGPLPYVYEVQARNETVVNFRPENKQAIVDLIAKDNIDYVYLGSNAGPLTPAVFANDPAFSTVYEHDGVIILAVNRQS